MYKGWTHTDPILEAPMRGNHLYHRDIYELVCAWTGGSDSSPYIDGKKNGQEPMMMFDERHPMLLPICSSILVEAARFSNPF